MSNIVQGIVKDLKAIPENLILLGFLDGNVELTPYLHLWKIGLVFKTYGNYKRYVLKNRN